MKKLFLLGLAVVLLPLSASAQLECPVGQIVQSVEVGAAVPEVPAVTHTEIVVDVPAYDEVVLVSAAYDEYVFQGFHQGDYIKIGSNYINVGHNNGFYDKVHHEAVTEIVHHDAVTHEVVITDVPAVPAVDPIFEDQCVADPEYVAPVVETPAPVVEKPASTPHPGGRRHCGTINTPSCEVWVAELNAKISGQPQNPQARLVELLSQVVALLQKLQGMQ